MRTADRVAVDVQTLVGDAEPVAAIDDLNRDGLVQLLEIHLALRRRAAGQNPVGSGRSIK